DPLFLQVKEAQASVLEPYAGTSSFPIHGERIVQGQRLMPRSERYLPGLDTNRFYRLLCATVVRHEVVRRYRYDDGERIRSILPTVCHGSCASARPQRRSLTN